MMPNSRFSTIYCGIGVYRARIIAVKRLMKKSVDITRKMKMELKALKDLRWCCCCDDGWNYSVYCRHDNLNSFVGACVEPGNVLIVSEYCTRGSLR